MRRGLRAQAEGDKGGEKLTIGQKLADIIAENMGSWRFIIIQTVILFFWIVLNVTAFIQKWDPYPFIFLNLMLSFQAAYAAPFIMMSQNRQSDIDRRKVENDYQVNVKAELEIEQLHQKVDELREKEVLALTEAVADLTKHVKNEGIWPPPASKAAPGPQDHEVPRRLPRSPAAKARQGTDSHCRALPAREAPAPSGHSATGRRLGRMNHEPHEPHERLLFREEVFRIQGRRVRGQSRRWAPASSKPSIARMLRAFEFSSRRHPIPGPEAACASPIRASSSAAGLSSPTSYASTRSLWN